LAAFYGRSLALIFKVPAHNSTRTWRNWQTHQIQVLRDWGAFVSVLRVSRTIAPVSAPRIRRSSLPLRLDVVRQPSEHVVWTVHEHVLNVGFSVDRARLDADALDRNSD